MVTLSDVNQAINQAVFQGSSVNASIVQAVYRSTHQSTVRGQSVRQSVNQSVSELVSPSLTYAISQAISQAIRHATSHSITASNHQSISCFAQMKLAQCSHWSVCRQQLALQTQHAQHSTCALHMGAQHAKHASLAVDASWPQAWPDSHEQSGGQSADQDCSRDAPVVAAQALPGQAAHKQQHHSAAYTAGHLLRYQGERSPGGAVQGMRRGGYGLSTVRPDTLSQQSCQPSNSHVQDDMDARWQNPKRQASGFPRRLYKHGPVVPKPSAIQRPIRRRQRPEWDDHLTAAAPQADRGTDKEGLGGFSPRPSAKELLQEALARIQNASSPRPQHAKRQRRSTAPNPVPHQQIATGKQPHLQSRPGVAQQDSGHSWEDAATATAAPQGAQQGCVHSWEDSATAARAPANPGPVQGGQQQAAVSVQPDKHALVKQLAFGGKPSWVIQSSAAAAGRQRGGDTQPAGRCAFLHDVVFIPTCVALRAWTVLRGSLIPLAPLPPYAYMTRSAML